MRNIIKIVQVLKDFIDKQQTRYDFSGCLAFLEITIGRRTIGGIVVAVELAQDDLTTIVQRNRHCLTFVILSLDLLGRRHEIGVDLRPEY